MFLELRTRTPEPIAVGGRIVADLPR